MCAVGHIAIDNAKNAGHDNTKWLLEARPMNRRSRTDRDRKAKRGPTSLRGEKHTQRKTSVSGRGPSPAPRVPAKPG